MTAPSTAVFRAGSMVWGSEAMLMLITKSPVASPPVGLSAPGAGLSEPEGSFWVPPPQPASRPKTMAPARSRDRSFLFFIVHPPFLYLYRTPIRAGYTTVRFRRPHNGRRRERPWPFGGGADVGIGPYGKYIRIATPACGLARNDRTTGRQTRRAGACPRRPLRLTPAGGRPPSDRAHAPHAALPRGGPGNFTSSGGVNPPCGKVLLRKTLGRR